ncbi:hypothetical protein ACQUWN_19355 [Rossellomorea aquimaris]|nr:hypothetical protein [Rossellomorea vietnamensis]
MKKTEAYLASISKSLEIIAEELKKRNEIPKPKADQATQPREVKHKVTK